MLYLLDANNLINAKRDYYQFKRVPEFWEWLIYQGQAGNIKIPIEVYEEFKDTKDSNGQKDYLATWAENSTVKNALLFQEEAKPEHVNTVVHKGYFENSPDTPTDDELIQMGKDPFLIAYALADPQNRCIVTAEVSKPTRKRGNRHVPDVCKTLGIQSRTIFQMINDLDFRTGWE